MARHRRREDRGSPSIFPSSSALLLFLSCLCDNSRAFCLYQRPAHHFTSFLLHGRQPFSSFPLASSFSPSASLPTSSLASSTSPAEPLDNVRETIQVRFINTPDGNDVVTTAQEGDNLMKVGDKAGISIPRACCTGLCGTCTSDLRDPSYTFKGEDKPAGAREGYQTIRACSTQPLARRLSSG
ncbi:expressed unknown protein [Nannochloropsis gaditana]|uniref:2Fe-2S ferredoxin-type domain-containing protein n=1 Tax=Nannochloropsis gaditana TaxID=72520 RepID=W7TBD5_9STRA|nr:expressed unknown protein [Nannochloropsis gaditana]